MTLSTDAIISIAGVLVNVPMAIWALWKLGIGKKVKSSTFQVVLQDQLVHGRGLALYDNPVIETTSVTLMAEVPG